MLLALQLTLSRYGGKMAKRTTTRTVVSRLQKKAHTAELRAITARDQVAVAKLRQDLSDGRKRLRNQMTSEEKQTADAIPTAARRRRAAVVKKRKSVDVRALLASAKRKK